MAIDKDDLTKNDLYNTFKGNQFTSWRGVWFWGVQGFILYNFLKLKHLSTPAILFGILMSSSLYFIFSYHLHYFQVSDHHFLFRSHTLFWKKKIYNIADIEEIVFERRGKMPNCLRVITKDFSNKLYPAGTLNNKTWLALKSKLETYGIIVRNESI